MNLFELAAKLTLDSSQYDEGLDKSEKEASNFGQKLAAALGTAGKVAAGAIAAVGTGVVAAGTAMVKAAGETAAYGDNIDKMSQKMGLSAEAYQEWDFIMQHSGTTVDGLQRGMTTLNKQITAANGTINAAGSQIAELNTRFQEGTISQEEFEAQSLAVWDGVRDNMGAFSALGLSLDDVIKMSEDSDYALQTVIERLQEMPEGAERAALAQELLGGAAKELGPLLNTSAEDTEAMRQQVHELGGVMSDEAVKAAAAYQDSLQNMQTAMSGIKTKLISDFLPGITKVMDGLTAVFSGDSGTGLGAIKEGISSVVTSISEQLPKIVELGTSIVTSLLTAITENLPQIVSAGTDMVLQLAQGFLDNLPEILAAGIEAVMAIVDGIAEALPELIPAAIGAVLQLVETLTEPSTLEHLIEAALELMIALALGLVKAIPQLIREAPVIISHVVQALVAEIPQLIGAALELIIALGSGLVEAIPELLVSVGEVLLAMVGGFINGVHDFLDVGRQFVVGLWEGISGAWDWIVSQVSSLFSGLVGSVKRVLGIRSPSRVMRDQVGKNIGLGVAEGIEDTIPDVEQASKDMAEASTGTLVYEADKDYTALMLKAKDYEEFIKLAALRQAKIIGENIDITAKNWRTSEQIFSEWKSSLNELTYDAKVDYTALIQQAKSYEEALNYAKLREAKIIGEGIDVTAKGWKTTESILSEWKTASEKMVYNAKTDYTALILAAQTAEEAMKYAKLREAKIVGEGIDVVAKGWKTTEQILKEWETATKKVGAAAESEVAKAVKKASKKASDLVSTVQDQMTAAETIVKNSEKNFRAAGKTLIMQIADGIKDGHGYLARSVQSAMAEALSSAGIESATSHDTKAMPISPINAAQNILAKTSQARTDNAKNIKIEFTGDLAQLGRLLQPVITAEGVRIGGNLVTA